MERLGGEGIEALPHVDLTDEDAVRAAVAAVLDADGRIDVLVNNAGIYPHRPFEELTFAEWRNVLATNLDSVYLCTHAAYPSMRERGYGRIVNVSSATFFIGYPGLTAYIASKGGIIGFTRALASEAGPHGITVNASPRADRHRRRARRRGGRSLRRDRARAGGPAPRRAGGHRRVHRLPCEPGRELHHGQAVNVDGGHRYH